MVNLPDIGNVSNIGGMINTKEIVKDALSPLMPFLKPVIEILLSIAGLYILYLIIKSIFNYLNARRIKRIDKNVQEILEILKSRPAKGKLRKK